MVSHAIPVIMIHCARRDISGNPQFGSDDKPADLTLAKSSGRDLQYVKAPCQERTYNNQVIRGNLFPQGAIPAHSAGGI